jgi:hypothetical protein
VSNKLEAAIFTTDKNVLITKSLQFILQDTEINSAVQDDTKSNQQALPKKSLQESISSKRK